MSNNPVQPPPLPPGEMGVLDAKTKKRIDTLYRNAKQFPLLTILSVLFCLPIVLLAAPLGLVYAVQRSRLLDELQGRDLGGRNVDATRRLRDIPTCDKVAMLRTWGARFYAPAIIVALAVGFAVFAVVTGPHRR
jgi:hypothetical protein